MTTVPLSKERPAGRLDQQLSELRRLRTEVSAEMIGHRRIGDLDNNDAYHRSVTDLEALDSQIARIHAVLEAIDEPDLGDDTVRIGSVVTVEFDHDHFDRARFLLWHFTRICPGDRRLLTRSSHCEAVPERARRETGVTCL